MFRVCSYCERIIGVKEPFTDTSETHGICAECEEVENRKIDAVNSKSEKEEK